jgi:hypothetical protein
MKRLIKFINGKNSGKRVFELFILTNAVYAFMLMFTIPKTMKSSDGMELLDMMPKGYDLNYVSELFKALGETGRETYLMIQIPMDMIYPLLFGLSNCLILAYFLNKINKLNTPFIYLCLLPIIGGIADYFENFGIIKMLRSYPNLTETTVKTTNSFTVLKSISTSLFFIALIAILILVGFKAAKKRVGQSINTSGKL